jgi:hypothetical protein
MVTSALTKTTFPCCFVQKQATEARALEFFLFLDDEEKRDLSDSLTVNTTGASTKQS